MIQSLLKKLLDFASSSMFQALVLFFSRSFHSLSSLIFSFIVGRLLTIEEHGLYSQYLARMVIFQAILETGLQYSLIRYLSPAISEQKESQIHQLLAASIKIKIYSFIVVFVLVVYWTLENFLYNFFHVSSGFFPLTSTPYQITNAWLVFLSALGMSFFSYFDALLVSHKNYRTLSFWIPLTGLSRILLLFLFFFWNQGYLEIKHVLFSFMAGTFFPWLFYFLFFDAKKFFFPVQKIKIQFWTRKLIRYNLWILFASFFAMLSDWMEILMLTQVRDAGLFNAARTPTQGIVILLSTMQSIMLPTMSRFQNPDEYKQYFKKIYKYVLLLFFLLLPLVYVGEWFITLWYGDEYYQAVNVFWVIYPSFLLRLFFAPLGTALFSLDQTVLIAIEAFLRMLGSFLFNWILIPQFGIMGAAYSTLFSQFFGWFFLIFLFTHYFKKGKFPEFMEKIKTI
ncbi:MAG: oligosaccharide flippase family protein [Leptospiraceae bacterium]|nr:oligosaccharide flippase family protein [Leptospiraceae bacterium]MDW7976029.1 oligosaccharide flippase family protein [Leptospiraceae bacterium]